MTNEEKIQNFKKRAMEKAQLEARELKFEYQAAYQEIIQDFVADARRKADTKFKAQKEFFVKKKNKAIAEANIKARKKYGIKSDELMEKIFNGVKKRLMDYMKTNEYDDLLKRKITEAKVFAKNREIVIYINTSDADKKEMLEKETGTSLTVSTMDFIGGMRAVIGEREILIDESFETRIEEEKDNFIF